MSAKAKSKATPKAKTDTAAQPGTGAVVQDKPPAKTPARFGSKNHTVSDYAQALRESMGFVSGAADLLGVTPSAVYKSIQRHPSLRELQKLLVEDRRQPALDISESKLLEAVCAGKSWAIKYYLNNQGADRGYGPKLALSGKLGAELTAGDPLAAYRAMPSSQRKKRIAELLERAKALEEE
jgi:hypothetical protein